MKIVILDGYTLNPGDLSWAGFEAMGSLKVYDRTKAEEIVSRIGDAEIVITNKTPLSRDTIMRATNIKYIGVLATGYNVVDVEAAKENGIPVTNIPTYGTTSVAQFTFALLLEICHHVGIHSQAVRDGEWSINPDFSFWKFPLIELADKTIGIIGYGRIGQSVGNVATALGMKVLAYDQYPNKSLENDNVRYVSLDVLLANADVITLHCPLTPENEGLINKSTIASMKDGVIILNTARGPLINEHDLAEGLNSGKVYGAAIDVVSSEPIKPDNPLLTAKNCMITPHIAWAPKEARTRLMEIAVANLKAFIDGAPIFVVNA